MHGYSFCLAMSKVCFYCYKPYIFFVRNSSLVTLRFNTLIVNEIWRNELTFSLITLGCFGLNVSFSWFRLTLNVMSYKCNSSQRKRLIISSLCVDVTSDEFLWKIFLLLFHVMINAFGLCHVSLQAFLLIPCKSIPFECRKVSFWYPKDGLL